MDVSTLVFRLDAREVETGLSSVGRASDQMTSALERGGSAIDQTRARLELLALKLRDVRLESARDPLGDYSKQVAAAREEFSQASTKLAELKRKEEEAAEGAHGLGRGAEIAEHHVARLVKSVIGFAAVDFATEVIGLGSALEVVRDAMKDAADTLGERLFPSFRAWTSESKKLADELERVQKALTDVTKYTIGDETFDLHQLAGAKDLTAYHEVLEKLKAARTEIFEASRNTSLAHDSGQYVERDAQRRQQLIDDLHKLIELRTDELYVTEKQARADEEARNVFEAGMREYDKPSTGFEPLKLWEETKFKNDFEAWKRSEGITNISDLFNQNRPGDTVSRPPSPNFLSTQLGDPYGRQRDADLMHETREQSLADIAGRGTVDQLRGATDQLSEMDKIFTRLVANADLFGTALADGINAVLFEGASLRDFFRLVSEEIARAIVQATTLGLVRTAFGVPFFPVAAANGLAFSAGNVVPFAYGGVVNSPMYFGMSGGRAGLMGEAGPEAVVPLKRGRDGKLGVGSSGASEVNITQNFYGPQDQGAMKRSARQAYDDSGRR